MNDTLPDVDRLFRKKLQLDMSESDVSERVLKYFMQCSQLIEENGLVDCFEGQHGSKEKCKLLIESLSPNELKSEVKNAIRFQAPAALKDECKLHDLILAKALEQDRDCLRRKRARYDEQFTKKEKAPRLQDRKHSADTHGGGRHDSVSAKETRDRDANRVVRTASKTLVEKVRPAVPKDGCLKCGGAHYVASCPPATPQEKKELPKKFHSNRAKKTRMKRIKERLGGVHTIKLNDVFELRYCADTGSDWCLISRKNFEELARLGSGVLAEPLQKAVVGKAVGGHDVEAREAVRLQIRLHTAAGPVEPADLVTCLIIEEDEDEFIVGNDVLLSLGIDVSRQLEQLAGNSQEQDDDPFNVEDDARSGLDDDDEIRAGVELLIEAALENEFPAEFVDELRRIVFKHDIWRLVLRDDPPAKVPPYKLRLKENAKPFRCKARQYAPLQSTFLREFNKTLVELGWVYKNPSSRWVCAALPLRKPKSDEFRQAVDYKPLNAMTESIAGLMPNLKTKLERVRGKKHYGLFDFIRSFWQLAVAEESREMLSYMTDEGVFTPNRVMQGSCDSALHFQVSMEDCFAELLHNYLLIWIDDLLLFADTTAEYLLVLEKLFDLVHEFRLKLSLKKSSLYQQSVTWCGKVIDQNSIRHDPKRIEGLTAMPPPCTAGQLQQFICATNWMRDSLIDYARVVHPLQQCLDVALNGKRKTKRVASGIVVKLNEEEVNSFNQVKTLLQKSAQLAHPRDGATFCLFVDASDVGWASILTQVATWKTGVAVTDQAHELLICKGGTFHGVQQHWSVIEKEGYPIVLSCEDLDYILLRPGGFKIFCDHRNLIHVFATGQEIKKHT
ncbi:hypothetical protein PHMEG_00013278 [Phytophthora megakarya]|uniref:Reverse transcriptase domain-containing protein n=1 Tax=Phytophthora megakarya TaxID=4795 RepID=A0A225W991_9STRA|nr:hypothetical protein PHMEG_00013278 [Phytophthora megakarya]